MATVAKAKAKAKPQDAGEYLSAPAHVRTLPEWVQELTDLAKKHFVKTVNASVTSLIDKDTSFSANIPLWVSTCNKP